MADLHDLYDEVKVPQQGVNDQKLLIVKWNYEDMEKVSKGSVLAELESSKAVFELESEFNGYFYHLVNEGDYCPINDTVALILYKKETKIVKAYKNKVEEMKESTENEFSDINLTNKARELVEKHNISLDLFPKGKILRACDILEFVDTDKNNNLTFGDINRIAIIGAGRGAVNLTETLKSGGNIEVVCYVEVDKNLIGTSIDGIPIYNENGLESKFKNNDIGSIIVAIANRNTRIKKIQYFKEKGFHIVNAIHKNSFISPSAKIGEGCHVKMGAIIDTNCAIGMGCIIDNGVIIAHDCIIKDGCHLAPGVSLGGGVKIGEKTLIGVGSTIAPQISLGSSVIIATGVNVNKNIPDNSLVGGPSMKITGKVQL